MEEQEEAQKPCNGMEGLALLVSLSSVTIIFCLGGNISRLCTSTTCEHVPSKRKPTTTPNGFSIKEKEI